VRSRACKLLIRSDRHSAWENTCHIIKVNEQVIREEQVTSLSVEHSATDATMKKNGESMIIFVNFRLMNNVSILANAKLNLTLDGEDVTLPDLDACTSGTSKESAKLATMAVRLVMCTEYCSSFLSAKREEKSRADIRQGAERYG
jgi:hypothetical protein